jgi:uncharacterized membrane protein required for colicin V production
MGRVVMALGGGAIVGMATVADDMVSAIFLLFILLMGIRGYLLGAMKIAAGILGLLAAIQWAPSLSPYLAKAPQLVNATANWNQIPGSLRGWICLIGAGLLIGLVVILVTRFFAHALFHSKPSWKWADHWLGATFGGIEGVVLSAIFIFAAMMLEPMARQQLANANRDEAGSLSRAWPNSVITVTQSVRESAIGNTLESLEPLKNRFDQQMQTLTRAVNENDGQDNSFQDKLMKMIEQMKSDPAARSILSSRTNLDDASLRALLDSQEFNDALQKIMPIRE